MVSIINTQPILKILKIEKQSNKQNVDTILIKGTCVKVFINTISQ